MGNNIFGQRIRELRIDKGLSQVELAAELGFRKQKISDWENGKLEANFDMLVKIADYFGVSIDYLLGREDY